MFGIENLSGIIHIFENGVHEIVNLRVYSSNLALSNLDFLVVVLSILLTLEDFLLHVGVNYVESDLEGL